MPVLAIHTTNEISFIQNKISAIFKNKSSQSELMQDSHALTCIEVET